MLPLVCGTLLIVVGAGIVALPLGLGAAIYLSEFASGRIRGIIKPLLEVLAGIPTVVYGYFALTFVTPVLQSILPMTQVFNAASAALVVGIMILPMVASLCDDALQAVPGQLRHAAHSLGATPYEVSVGVVVPGALSGVLASFVLALSRAFGETMAVTLAAGASPKLTLNPLESIQTMTAYIVQVSLGDTPGRHRSSTRRSSRSAALLFVITSGDEHRRAAGVGAGSARCTNERCWRSTQFAGDLAKPQAQESALFERACAAMTWSGIVLLAVLLFHVAWQGVRVG